MATSGVTVWQKNRDSIISAALRKIGVIGEGVSASSTQLSEGEEALNTVISEFQALGMPLWKRKELSITLVSGQKEYTIGEGLALDEPFPLKLLQANLALTGSATRLNMQILAHYDYNNLPVTSTGTPVQVTYQPFINYGVLSVWPTPNDSVPVGSSVIITYQSPAEIFTSGTETMDFPQEWYNAVIYNLSLVLADEYGIPIPDKQWLEKQAEKHLNTALSIGTEDASITFYPDRNR